MMLRPAAHSKVSLQQILPGIVLIAVSILARLPVLATGNYLNSDGAVVGLQAEHILRGEWSWFLWGSGYQTVVDSAWAALVFFIFGSSPLTLVWSAFALYLLLTWFAYATLRRHLGGVAACLACMALVFAPDAVHTYALRPPRQAALTLAFAALALIDRASTHDKKPWFYAVGAAFIGLAVFADPYALVLVPGLVVLALLATADEAPGRTAILRRVGWTALGGVIGCIPYVLLRRIPGATPDQTELGFANLSHNYRMLVDPCLPWILSLKAYYAPTGFDVPWHAGWFIAVQWAGGLVLAIVCVTAIRYAVARDSAWKLRRLVIAALVTVAVTFAGFLLSVMVIDVFSARYLTSLILMLPFLCAPLATQLDPRRFAFVCSPYWASAAVGAWLVFFPMMKSPYADEQSLHQWLRAKNIRYGIADYWTAYFETFMFHEDTIVVPIGPRQDRYRPYRNAFEVEPRIVYVYDKRRSFEARDKKLTELLTHAHEVETFHVGGLSAVILQRNAQ